MPYNEVKYFLTFTTLWANSADGKLIFFLFFPETRLSYHYMQIVSLGDNLHESNIKAYFYGQIYIPKPVFMCKFSRLKPDDISLFFA